MLLLIVLPVALVGFAIGAPVQPAAVERRQLPSVGALPASGGVLDRIFPGLGGSGSGGLPTTPTIPNIPNIPTIPDLPSFSILPIPNIPTLPTLPALPTGSTLPTLPTTGEGLPIGGGAGSATPGGIAAGLPASSTLSTPGGGGAEAESASGGVTDEAAAVRRRQFSFPGIGGSGSTRNDVTSGVCKAITVIFARGTGELGNVGSSAGPAFFTALASKFGEDKVAVQGVAYAATAAGFVGDPAGNAALVSLVNRAIQNCPTTQIVLSGYSQGAMIVHNGAKSLSATAVQRIGAVVTFGDPYSRSAPAVGAVPNDRVRIICHTGDAVCNLSFIITAQHLNYGQDAGAAADFVASKITV